MIITFGETQAKLRRYSRGWIVLLMLLITWALYGYMLSTSIPKVMGYSGGAKLLDMKPTGYTVEYARELFSALGENGRHAYSYEQIPVDMVYPFFFALSYSLLLTYLFGKGFHPDSWVQNLTIIPIYGGIFDYLENIGIIYHLQTYPQFSDTIIRITNVCSVLKSAFTTMFFLLLVVGLVRIAIRRSGNRSNQNLAAI
jgi:hypothetical protein